MASTQAIERQPVDAAGFARPGIADVEGARASRAELAVDHAAIRHNVREIEQLAGGARVVGVIKGDAYGLGAVEVARTLRDAHVPAFAVDSVAEGLVLRAAGLEEPIVVLDGDTPDNAGAAVRWNLTPGIAHEELLYAYNAAAESAGVNREVWVAANVGFNRSGYQDANRFARFLRVAAACRSLTVRCVYAHLTNAHAEDAVSRDQIACYQRIVDVTRSTMGAAIETSLFASHGIPRWSRELQTDWVRPGLLLYGEHMFAPEQLDARLAATMARFEPAVTLKARVVQVVEFERADFVGYGRRHAVRAGQRLATLSIGFGGGHPPGATRTIVSLGNRPRTTVGAVGMDAMQVDATAEPAPQRGDWAVLIGTIDGRRYGVTELAQASGLSPYEFLSRLNCHRRHERPTMDRV